MNEQLPYRIALTRITNVGVKAARQLIGYCGSSEAVFAESRSRLLKIPGIGEKIATAISTSDPHSLSAPDIDYLSKNNINTVFFLEDNYPKRLKQLDDSPILLFYYGKPNWNHPSTVAIVGTRKPNSYGLMICSALIEGLKQSKIQVISGLAYGVDGKAHQACIEAGIENIAIMGTGIDTVYPSDHRGLARRIVGNGAIATEYPIRTRADKENFPRRNRVIAGLADVTVVIQSALKGGSMITAAFANGYHKDVAAFPGRSTDSRSAGCNFLIKTNRAHLIESAEDLTSIMQWQPRTEQPAMKQSELFRSLDATEEQVFEVLSQHGELHIDHMQSLLNMTPGTLAASLLQLEFMGMVQPLPGKRYTVNS